MWKKLKVLPAGAKWMIVLIIVALICIATRWEYIRDEASEAFKSRFERPAPLPRMIPVDTTDSL